MLAPASNASCVDSTCSAMLSGTAGLSALVGSDPVMATQMMQGVWGMRGSRQTKAPMPWRRLAGCCPGPVASAIALLTRSRFVAEDHAGPRRASYAAGHGPGHAECSATRDGPLRQADLRLDPQSGPCCRSPARPVLRGGTGWWGETGRPDQGCLPPEAPDLPPPADTVCQIIRILPDPPDKWRCPPRQPGQPQKIQARHL